MKCLIYQYLRIYIKIICQRFRIITLFRIITIFVKYAPEIYEMFVYKQKTVTIEYVKK